MKNLIVLKYGGSILEDKKAQISLFKQIIYWQKKEYSFILIHGGGKEVNCLLDKLGKKPKFVQGLRVTDTETMEVVEMVLRGKVNSALVGKINSLGGKAVGLGGKDGGLLAARKLLNPDLGLVGQVRKVNPGIIIYLLKSGFIPVLCSIGGGQQGESYNLNADTVAGEIAGVLSAGKLVILSDVNGILKNIKDASSVIPVIRTKEFSGLVKRRVIREGMIPKIRSACQALKKGAGEIIVVDGRLPGILTRIIGQEKVGTRIIK